MENVVVIIPAYKPDDKLLFTLKDLLDIGFKDIIVVNDGSGPEFDKIFDKVKEIYGCTLLHHEINKGKGAALKTAIGFVLENRSNCAGVVTADADGQHLTKDILRTSEKMKESEKIVLGVRDFSSSNVPFRSKLGNLITIGVFRIFLGTKISDTQTGLRAFPINILPEIIKIDGERYEYETNILVFMSKNKIPFEEVKINTVYIDENNSSHFHVVKDSIRIYSLIIKYIFSSVIASIVDETAFFVFQNIFYTVTSIFLIPTTFISAILARLISSLVNFFINARVVFHGVANKKTIARYYILVICQVLVSAALVFTTEYIFNIKSPLLSTFTKIIIDIILFFFSFRIQHKWVFNEN